MEMRDPADTRRWINVGLTLTHCLLRWTNVKPTLLKRLVFAGSMRTGAGSRNLLGRLQIVARKKPFSSPKVAHHSSRILAPPPEGEYISWSCVSWSRCCLGAGGQARRDGQRALSDQLAMQFVVVRSSWRSAVVWPVSDRWPAGSAWPRRHKYSKHETLNQCWADVADGGPTLVQCLVFAGKSRVHAHKKISCHFDSMSNLRLKRWHGCGPRWNLMFRL